MCGICGEIPVDKEDEVCFQCQETTTCYECGKYPLETGRMTYCIVSNIFVRDPDNNEKMCADCGESPRSLNNKNLCKKCTEKRATRGHFPICMTCLPKIHRLCKVCDSHKDLILNTGVCVECNYSVGWAPDSGIAKSSCAECGKTGLALNSAGMCKTCYTDQEMKNAGVVVSRCTDCGDVTHHTHGRCSRCRASDILKAPLCIHCGHNEVDSPRAICEECQELLADAPGAISFET